MSISNRVGGKLKSLAANTSSVLYQVRHHEAALGREPYIKPSFRSSRANYDEINHIALLTRVVNAGESYDCRAAPAELSDEIRERIAASAGMALTRTRPGRTIWLKRKAIWFPRCPCRISSAEKSHKTQRMQAKFV
jgi:hypothetical protein